MLFHKHWHLLMHDPDNLGKIPTTPSGHPFRFPRRAASNYKVRNAGPDFCPGWWGIALAEGTMIRPEQIDRWKNALQTRVPANVWIHSHETNWPMFSVCRRPPETRMGKGKSDISGSSFKLKGGTVLFSFMGAKLPLPMLLRIIRKIRAELSAPIKVVSHGWTREPYVG